MATNSSYDYSAYKNLSAYTEANSVYKAQMDAAKNADRANDSAKEAAVLGSVVGAIAGITALASGAGATSVSVWSAAGSAAGATAGLFTNGGVINWLQKMSDKYKWGLKIASTSARDTQRANILGSRNLDLANAKSAANERNLNVLDTRRFINATRSNYDMTYGAGSFGKIEQTVMGLLGMSTGDRALSSILSGLETNSSIEGIKSRLVTNSDLGEDGVFDSDDINSLLEANFSLAELGAAYTDYIYETYMRGDSAVGDAARELSLQKAEAQHDYEMGAEELNSRLSQQFVNAFFGAYSQNVSDAKAIGGTQAEAGASGLRVRGSSGATKMQRFQQDLAQASYAATLSYYKSDLDRQYAALETSRSHTFNQISANTLSLKRNISAGVTESINNYLYGAGTRSNAIWSEEIKQDNSTGRVIAANNFLKGNDRNFVATLEGYTK